MFRLVFVIALSLLILGCEKSPDPLPKFQVQELVKTVVGDYPGMILEVNCTSYKTYCVYEVRLAVPSMRTSQGGIFFGGGGGKVRVKPWSISYRIRDYELKKIK